MAPHARRVAVAVAAVLGLPLGLFIAVVLAAPAQAHAQLISTTPAAGQTVSSVPAVQLEFSGDVIAIGLRFQVIGPAGPAMRGLPTIAGHIVSQPLASSLADGGYLVNWHVVHDDGHPDSGTFSFVLASGQSGNGSGAGPAAGSGGSSPPATPQTLAAVPISEPAADEAPGLPPVWTGLGLLVVVAVVVVAVVVDRRRRAEPAGRR